MPVEEVFCSDQHFEAALSLVTTCLEHSRLLITSIKSRSTDMGELSNPYKCQCVLAALPATFSTSDFLKIAVEQGVGVNSAKKMIYNAIGLKISKLKWGWYKKLD